MNSECVHTIRNGTSTLAEVIVLRFFTNTEYFMGASKSLFPLQVCQKLAARGGTLVNKEAARYQVVIKYA